MRIALIAAAFAAGAGCGYVGEPLPPLVNIPARVEIVTVAQTGTRVAIEFSVPAVTTEGKAIPKPPRIELRAGMAADPFNLDAWASSATPLDAIPDPDGRVRKELPAEPWIGKEIFVAVRVIGANGRDAGWSPVAAITVGPPPEPPADVTAVAVREGVRVRWRGSGEKYRLYRQGIEESETLAATADAPEWVDKATEYGKTYRYRVQTLQRSGASVAASEPSSAVEITPQDKFAPAVPSGLQAIAGTASIELAWEPDTEADLAGYRVYRVGGDGPLERLTDTVGTPNFSDRKIESGRRYRYAVTAIDRLGNESSHSVPVEMAAP